MSRTARDRSALIAVLSAMALVVLDAGMVNVALPAIAHDLAVKPARSMLLVTAYQLALLTALLPCAHLAERIGYRRLFLAGIVLFAAASMLSATAPTLAWLVAGRAAQGLGAAAILSVGLALLRFALGDDRLAAAIGWIALAVAICSALAPALGAVLIAWAGWPWLFVAALPFALIALVAARALPPVPATRDSVDAPGIALVAAAAGGAIVAVELAHSVPLAALGSAAGALASAGWLFARQGSREAPLVPLDLLAAPPFRTSVLASTLLFAGQSAGLLALPFHLIFSLGQDIAATGLTVALWPLATAVTSRPANRLADRFSCQAVCVAGAVVLGVGLAGAALLPSGGAVAPLALCIVICGIGFGLFQVPNNRMLLLAAPAARSAAAGALQGTARLAGQTIGALIVTFILSAAALAAAPRLAMAVAAVAAAAAALVSWPRRPSAPAGDERPTLGSTRPRAKAARGC